MRGSLDSAPVQYDEEGRYHAEVELRDQADHYAASTATDIERAVTVCGLPMLNEALKDSGYQLVQQDKH